MSTQQSLDGLVSQAIHLLELRLLVNRDMPENVHKVIRNESARLRDEIVGHPMVEKAAFTDSLLSNWNKAVARKLGVIA